MRDLPTTLNSHASPTSFQRLLDIATRGVCPDWHLSLLSPSISHSAGSGTGRRGNSSSGRECTASLEHFQSCGIASLSRFCRDLLIPSRGRRLVRTLSGLLSLVGGIRVTPLLRRKLDCRDSSQAVTSLERHRPLSLLLELGSCYSTDAVSAALGHRNNIASISAYLAPDQLQFFHSRLAGLVVEDPVLSVRGDGGRTPKWNITVGIQGEFRSIASSPSSGFRARRPDYSPKVHTSLGNCAPVHPEHT